MSEKQNREEPLIIKLMRSSLLLQVLLFQRQKHLKAHYLSQTIIFEGQKHPNPDWPPIQMTRVWRTFKLFKQEKEARSLPSPMQIDNHISYIPWQSHLASPSSYCKLGLWLGILILKHSRHVCASSSGGRLSYLKTYCLFITDYSWHLNMLTKRSMSILTLVFSWF